MRSYHYVALLATLLFCAAQARQLTQEALSNSNGCLGTIPRCEQNACIVRNIGNTATWTCARCFGGYEGVVDASGQDNIIQCVCPRGFFEEGSTCVRCPSNSYCPGGDRVANPNTRGANLTCSAGLVTRNTGARTQTDCLAPAGFARTTPSTATVCGTSEYAPQFNRLTRCLRCQSGLREATEDNLGTAAKPRNSKRTVCKLPPGHFMSQGLVRACPQGFFRENFVEFDNAIGTVCRACNAGITTAGATSTAKENCNIVLPGYGLTTATSLTAAQALTLPAPTTPVGLPEATICAIGFYSGVAGVCVRCPKGSVTLSLGAKTVEECVVPPGYFLPASGDMTKCLSTSFRADWIMAMDPRNSSCTVCGTGIASEQTEKDDNPLAAANSLVAASSASCFIEPGHGMISQGVNQFSAVACPVNTYGAAARVYGWAAAPCKPCPRNMITDGATQVSNMSICVNDDGFGMASEGASRCAPGFYSAKGSMKPCQQCPAGRTTTSTQAGQNDATDCFVREGFGVANSAANANDAFNISVVGLTPAQQLALPVLECPIGYYSSDASSTNTTTTIARRCLQCPAGSTTQEPGRSQVSQCDVCSAGFGKATPAAACTLCTYGSFSAGSTNEPCRTCPTSTYYLPVTGGTATFTSNGWTTYQGAFGEEVCVPKTSQMSREAGQAFVPFSAPGPFQNASNSVNTLAQCIAACSPPDLQLCLAQWDSSTNRCTVATLEPASSTVASGAQLVYKLPPSTVGSASSVTTPADAPAPEADGTQVVAKTMPSGYYAHGAIPTGAPNLAAWSAIGSHLTSDARTFSTVAAPASGASVSLSVCKRLCDNSNVCVGFIWEPAQSRCNFRGGIDQVNSVAFFDMPTAVADLAGFRW